MNGRREKNEKICEKIRNDSDLEYKDGILYVLLFLAKNRTSPAQIKEYFSENNEIEEYSKALKFAISGGFIKVYKCEGYMYMLDDTSRIDNYLTNIGTSI